MKPFRFFGILIFIGLALQSTPAICQNSAAPSANDSGAGKESGLLGPILFGPSISLVSLPGILYGNFEVKATRFLGFAGYYGFFPKVTIGSAQMGLKDLGGKIRIFPFGGRFNIGASYGIDTLAARTELLPGLPVDFTLKMTYASPHLGARFTWESGFFYGFDLGWQFVLKSNLSAQVLNQSVELPADLLPFGKTGLPAFAWVQLGYLF